MSVIPEIYDRIQDSLTSIESTLHQSWFQVSGLLGDLKLLRSETESYKSEIINLKERCDKQTCSGSEALSKVIESKDGTLSSIVTTLKKIHDTKDVNYLNEIFKLLCIDRTDLTPPKCSQYKDVTPRKNENPLLQSESATFTMDVTIDNESISEIEGTPTGRTSPIIQTKTKSVLTPLLCVSEHKEKKKCPDNWPTPPKKTNKTASTPARSKTRMRQQRLNLSKLRTSSVVDLTSSPEFSGGLRTQETCTDVKPKIKQEMIPNDETILPSPTSGPIMFSSALYKTVCKSSPVKKKPSLKLKRDSDENEKQHRSNEVNKLEFTSNMEDSINLLNQQPHRFKKPASIIIELQAPNDPNCENEHNTSILKEVNKIEITRENQQQFCNSKQPLAENINVTNMECDLEASLSVLHTDLNVPTHTVADADRQSSKQILEPVYKEATVRKKAEKRALPGWSCDQCRIFYDVLYKDDPEMLAKLMNECSKHRGKKNPVRPNTPEGFWNPRWSVPEDTEEFNRQNHVD